MPLSLRKLPPRYIHIALPFVVSLLMSCLVSGISTAHGVGLTDNFVSIWMSSWAFSWIIAFPTLLFVLPMARRIVYLLVESGPA